MLRSLVPSFVADAVWPEHRTTYKLHLTSYLDGLRGIASIIVFICHYTEDNHPSLIPSYGLNPDGSPSSWLQLPFIRIIFSGRPMVHIFFVISGFVLSHKPLKAIHSRDLSGCFTILSSSAFRRPIRLFGPCIVSTFLIMLMIQLGWLYAPLPTLTEQFWAWKNAVFHSITWPWAWDFDLRPGYDIHLWTIPIEFAHSMLLFLVILMLSRVRQLVRQGLTVCLAVYFLCCGKWAAFEFIAGLFLAECHLLQSSSSKLWESSDPTTIYPHPPPLLGSLAWTTLHSLILLTALFIGGWPNFAADLTPGIRFFHFLTPEPFFSAMDPLAPQKFWFALSAAFTVYSVGCLPSIRRLLEGPVAQYCGRVSYAVYIVHGPTLAIFQGFVVGHPFMPSQGEPEGLGYVPARPASGIRAMVGGDSPVQRTVAWAMGLAVLAPVVVWAADVFWRLVDNPMIALGRRVEQACLDEGEEGRGRGFVLAG
ncbi:acyltransferase 3 [Coniochaeta sp. 2T2.1]|nr:acyltransferase 3 [Coniochaeta sp. 2T2.1]